MDWLRWHHGTVTDPKWRLIARRSRSDVRSVIAVWAVMLERASMADARGSIAGWSDEVAAIALDMEPDEVAAIRIAMQGLVLDGDSLSGWSKRQPKRERPDDGASTDRVRAYRERQKSEKSTACEESQDGVTADVTPCNATKRHETPRGEESRVEKNLPSPPSPSTPREAPADAARAVVMAFLAARNERWPDAMPPTNGLTQIEHARALLATPGATPELVADLAITAIKRWRDPDPPGGVGSLRLSIANGIARHVRAGTPAIATPVVPTQTAPAVVDRTATTRARLLAYRDTGAWPHGDPPPTSAYCQIDRAIMRDVLGDDFVSKHHGAGGAANG